MKTKKIIQTKYCEQPAVHLKNLTRNYTYSTAVENLTLSLAPGEIMALLGPSGCGKTTTLRIVAGLESPDRGEVWLHNTLVSSPNSVTPPYKRSVGMVFQDLALWPHMTAGQHLGFALNSCRYKGRVKKEKIDEILALVRLPKKDRYPHQLSGGEQQRLAIGRALAAEPRILLMDEPFSNLDPSLKQELLAEIKGLLARMQITTLYVTHQWEEAVYLADTIATMAGGKIESFSTAAELGRRITDKVPIPSVERNTARVIPLKAGMRI